jgi:hypothetical protein
MSLGHGAITVTLGGNVMVTNGIDAVTTLNIAPTTAVTVKIGNSGSVTEFAGDVTLPGTAAKLGFFAATGVVKGTVTGSRGGNAALASLLTLLASHGFLTDSSS